MGYMIKKSGSPAHGAIRMINSNKPSLASQHLEYTLMINQNRAIMTQHAMNNTEILMDVARQIAAENPATTKALEHIMGAYLEATADNIRTYGNPVIKNRR